jgi:hypothetical protein
MLRLVTVASVLSTYQKPAVMVDTSDDAQIQLWASRLNVSRDRLLAAVSDVGPSLAAVRNHLAK